MKTLQRLMAVLLVGSVLASVPACYHRDTDTTKTTKTTKERKRDGEYKQKKTTKKEHHGNKTSKKETKETVSYE